MLVGSLLHLANDWSGHNKLVAAFAAVNESYWELLKIAFWLVLLWLGGFFAVGGWQIPGFIPAMTTALYSVPVSMIAMGFGCKSITGKNLLWLDIVASTRYALAPPGEPDQFVDPLNQRHGLDAHPGGRVALRLNCTVLR